jgi:3-oxoacyl-(acyl-carrier-protein) synthase/acyl carrier protein
VLHAAGVIRDSLAARKTRQEVEAVLAPKVLGTLWLDEATRDEPLDFFASFSSVAAVLGNPGQCDYAYANAYMDAYAARRAALARQGQRMGRTVSIDWPLWRDGGMRLDERWLESLRVATGMCPFDPAEGLAALDRLLDAGEGQLLVLHGDPRRFARLLESRGGAVVGADEPRAAAAGRPADQVERGGLKAIQRELLRLAAPIAGVEEERINPEKSLVDYGFDSLSFSKLADQLNARFGLSLSPALFFEFSSVRKLAAHLEEAWGDKVQETLRAAAAPVQPAPAPAARPDEPARPARSRFARGNADAGAPRGQEPVAIVGIGGAMPQSDDLDDFWRHLEAGHDLVTEVPRERWETYRFAAALERAGEGGRRLWGGFLNDVDKFDARFFGLSPREAELMDPQHRIFLQSAWQAVEDAGHRMSELAGTRTGLFVGASTSDYAEIVRGSGAPMEAQMLTGLAHSVLANRISFLFDLRGPSEPIDTACSSALIALHRAAQAVAAGDCDQAIAGGVNALLAPSAYVSFVKAGMLSPDGRCKTFDRRANGYVRGEGAGAVLLKRLSHARRDGNPIYALIRGSAVNHGGRASSLTAPNVAAQASVLVEAYERAGIDPATIGYVEAHGTGTALGDPIEVDALGRAFRALFERRKQAPSIGTCGLGSVKTNVGHLEAAAGMAGLFKVLLAMKHRVLPASLHFEELNPYIRLEGSPFYVVRRRAAWEAPLDADGRPLPRRAGISSFGFGGANAHVVLEEHPAAAPMPAAPGPRLFVLSARTDERLRAYAGRLARHLERAGVPPGADGAAARPDALDLDALAYTLQVGREPLERRLAVVASSAAELRTRLEVVRDGGIPPQGVYVGGVGPARDADDGGPQGEQAVRDGKLDAVAALWASGAAVELGALRRDATPRRIALPTYPFAPERHWLEVPTSRPGDEAPTTSSGPPTGDDGGTWRERLASAREDRQRVLQAYLRERIASMLKLGGPDELDPSRPLVAMGLDSLMALQLKKLVQTQLQLDLSLLKLLGGESTAELAARIAALLWGGDDPATPGRDAPAIPAEDPHADVLEGVL